MASIAAILAAFGAGVYVHSRIAEHTLESRLKEQSALLIGQCKDNIKITEESSNEYQKRLAVANRKLADYRKLYSGITVPITGEAGRSDASSRGAVDAGKAGVPVVALLEYGGECEQYRSQVIGLQGFINRVWK